MFRCPTTNQTRHDNKQQHFKAKFLKANLPDDGIINVWSIIFVSVRLPIYRRSYIDPVVVSENVRKVV